MKTLTRKSAPVQSTVTVSAATQPDMDELLDYPQESLGFHLGKYLFDHSFEPDPKPGKEDILRLLITPGTSNIEDVAMYFYLFGNGNRDFRTLFIMATGMLIFPYRAVYFIRRYRKGKAALRFFDLDHFRMLHLPVSRIKSTFLIG